MPSRIRCDTPLEGLEPLAFRPGDDLVVTYLNSIGVGLLVLLLYGRKSALGPHTGRLRRSRVARARPLLGEMSHLMSVDALGVRTPLTLGALLDAPPRISFQSSSSRSTPSYMIPRATAHLQRPAARRRPYLHPRIDVPQLDPIQPRRQESWGRVRGQTRARRLRGRS